MKPLLSVIIPCYNNGNYLVKMIDCFRRQTSSDWEMIIVDDGSTDDTPIVVKERIKDVPNIQYMPRNREPKGSVVCRNIGFEYSKGKYVCHLDADDLVSDTFVEHRVAFMEAHPDIDYASFPAKSFRDENNLPTFSSKVDTWGVGEEGMDLLEKFLRVEYPFSVWNNIYRKEAIKDLPWDETVQIYTDFSFIIPCILSGLKHSFSGIEEVDYFYRVVPSNKVAMTTSFISQAKCDSTIYLFSKTMDSLISNDLFEKYKRDFFRFIVLHYVRMLKGGTFDNVNKYILLVKKYYKNTICFHLTRNLVRLKNGRAKTLIIDYVCGFVFGRKDFVQTANYLLKHRINKVLSRGI